MIDIWIRETKIAPALPGVYSIWDGDELLYIGKTVNFKNRLTGHGIRAFTENCPLLSFRFLHIENPTQRSLTEKYLIRKHSPKRNITYKLDTNGSVAA